MRESLAKIFLHGLLLGALVLAPGADADSSRVVEGVAVYLGMVPAQIVRGHPSGHVEAKMHGGATPGETHVMVALFDATTGKRITDANVSARVRGDRDAVEQKRLEPMVIAGAETYGNYFSLLGSGPFRITIYFRTPGVASERHAEFSWRTGS